MSAPFHFVVFLRLFLIGEALLPWYRVINYQQRVIAVYINYVSRPSPHCAFMFHGCITSSDMKYLLWHVPVTLISPIRCNFLLFLWNIAGKCDQSAGCRRQPAAILNPAFIIIFSSVLWRIIWQLKMVMFCHQHPQWDKNPWFLPQSEKISIFDFL